MKNNGFALLAALLVGVCGLMIGSLAADQHSSPIPVMYAEVKGEGIPNSNPQISLTTSGWADTNEAIEAIRNNDTEFEVLRLVFALWEDGTVVWSEDSISGGKLYYIGQIADTDVTNLLEKVRSEFSEYDKENWWYPQSGGVSSWLSVDGVGDKGITVRAWHPVAEQRFPEYITVEQEWIDRPVEDEMESLRQLNASQEYVTFRKHWRSIMDAINASLPGEPGSSVAIDVRHASVEGAVGDELNTIPTSGDEIHPGNKNIPTTFNIHWGPETVEGDTLWIRVIDFDELKRQTKMMHDAKDKDISEQPPLESLLEYRVFDEKVEYPTSELKRTIEYPENFNLILKVAPEEELTVDYDTVPDSDEGKVFEIRVQGTSAASRRRTSDSESNSERRPTTLLPGETISSVGTENCEVISNMLDLLRKARAVQDETMQKDATYAVTKELFKFKEVVDEDIPCYVEAIYQVMNMDEHATASMDIKSSFILFAPSMATLKGEESKYRYEIVQGLLSRYTTLTEDEWWIIADIARYDEDAFALAANAYDRVPFTHPIDLKKLYAPGTIQGIGRAKARLILWPRLNGIESLDDIDPYEVEQLAELIEDSSELELLEAKLRSLVTENDKNVTGRTHMVVKLLIELTENQEERERLKAYLDYLKSYEGNSPYRSFLEARQVY